MSIYRSPEGMLEIRAWCEARLAAWEFPHQARTIPSILGSTHVVTAGHGPDLVLLPGTNFAAATWLDLIATLAEDHTVHALDLPGQPGLSGADRPNRSADRHGAWLAEVATALGTDRPVIVAHSLGAVTALRAIADGAISRRVVLLDPAGLMRLKVGLDVMRPTVPWLRKPNDATSAALLTTMMARGHTPEPDLAVWMSLVGQHVRTSLAPSPVPARVLRTIADVPVEVLSGREDIFLPPARLERALHRRLPTASLRFVDGAGHLLPHERPDAVRDWLDRVGPR